MGGDIAAACRLVYLPCTGDRDVESVGVSDKTHVATAVAAHERADDDVVLLTLIIIHLSQRRYPVLAVGEEVLDNEPSKTDTS